MTSTFTTKTIAHIKRSMDSMSTHSVYTTSLSIATSSSPSSSPSSSSDNNDGGWSESGAWMIQRWALFVIFFIIVIVTILATLRSNYKRVRAGQRPIAGTAWFTPPSYYQSERQHNSDDGVNIDSRNQRNQEEFVPQYTEEVNPDDLGFYDDKGLFHINSKAKPMAPPPSDYAMGDVVMPGSLFTRVELNSNNNDNNANMETRNIHEEGFIQSPEQAMLRERARSEYYNYGVGSSSSGAVLNADTTGGNENTVNSSESIEMTRFRGTDVSDDIGLDDDDPHVTEQHRT